MSTKGLRRLKKAAIDYKARTLRQGKKLDTNKLRFDLIPPMPLEETAHVYTIGAIKYDDRNWEKGLRWGRIFGAMMRHGWAFWRGERYDRECPNPECRTYLPIEAAADRLMPCPKCGTGGKRQHHLASVSWCAFTLMEYEDTHVELDDRPEHARTIKLVKEDSHG